MNKKERELVRLGKMLRDFAELGVVSRKELLWVSFLRGIAQGFGAIIGGTILIALFVWILGLFNEVPFLGEAADVITDTVTKN
jgi:hypothetical protein